MIHLTHASPYCVTGKRREM